MKILFVCSGNTCRSPMAQAIANHKVKELGIEKQIKFESAGLVGPSGVLITKEAKCALEKMAIKVGTRKSRVLEYRNLNKYQLIITMTNFQKQKINLQNCFSFSDLCGKEINDPYGQPQAIYDYTAKQLDVAVEILLKRILEKGEEK